MAMKVAIEQNLKEAPQLDLDAINTRKQKRLAKATTDEDRGLNSFGIAKKIQKKNHEWTVKEEDKEETVIKGKRREWIDSKGAQNQEEAWVV